MSKLIARFAKDESGATAIEYGLIAALIGVAIMIGSEQVGDAINNLFGRIAGQMEDVTATPEAPTS